MSDTNEHFSEEKKAPSPPKVDLESQKGPSEPQSFLPAGMSPIRQATIEAIKSKDSPSEPYTDIAMVPLIDKEGREYLDRTIEVPKEDVPKVQQNYEQDEDLRRRTQSMRNEGSRSTPRRGSNHDSCHYERKQSIALARITRGPPVPDKEVGETGELGEGEVPVTHVLYAPISLTTWLTFGIIYVFEILMLIFYGIFARFNYQELDFEYASFQDINVMILLGFGFLMSYLKNHSWGSIGLSFMVAVMSIQAYPLMHSFWNAVFVVGFGDKIGLNVTMAAKGLFSAGASLISFGVIIGRTTVPQILVMVLVQQAFFSLNETLLREVIRVQDIGSSMNVHLFGSVFGIVVGTVFLWGSKLPQNFVSNSASYQSTIFSFIGSIFLWIYWPSFNSALALSEEERMRSVVNTHFSLAASALCTFGISPLINNNLFSVEEVLNASLAGGVIIGSSANWIFNPIFSILLGCIGGVISSLGFRFLSRALHTRGVYDAVGVINLHLVPGLLGGLFSAVICAIWYEDPVRSASAQGWIQVGGVGVTLGIALGSGVLAGLLLRRLPSPLSKFEDSVYWIVDEH